MSAPKRTSDDLMRAAWQEVKDILSEYACECNFPDAGEDGIIYCCACRLRDALSLDQDTAHERQARSALSRATGGGNE